MLKLKTQPMYEGTRSFLIGASKEKGNGLTLLNGVRSPLSPTTTRQAMEKAQNLAPQELEEIGNFENEKERKRRTSPPPKPRE